MTARPKQKNPSFPFYVRDWLVDDCLARCSLATRGAWIDLLAHMHLQKKRGVLSGTIQQLSKLCRATVDETSAAILDLAETGTTDIFYEQETRPAGPELREKMLHVTVGNINVTLMSRRMCRERKHVEGTKVRVQKHRRKVRCNAHVTAPYSAPASASASASAQQQQALPVAAEEEKIPPEEAAETAPPKPMPTPPPSDQGAAVEILHRAGLGYELARVLVRSHEVEPIPLLGMFAEAPKDVRNLAGWARKRIADGDWRPEGKAAPAWFLSAVKLGLVASINGRPVTPEALKWNATGLYVANGGDAPALLAATKDLESCVIG